MDPDSVPGDLAGQLKLSREIGALLDLYLEISIYSADQRPVPAALAARSFRHRKQMGGVVEMAVVAHQRELLQEQRDDGNEYAAEVLGLLSDDPWWEQTDD